MDECSLRSPMKPQLSSRFSIITSSINTRNNCTLIFRLCSVCPLYSFSNWDASSIICENFLTYTHETLFVAKSSLSLTPSKQIFSFASFTAQGCAGAFSRVCCRRGTVGRHMRECLYYRADEAFCEPRVQS